MDVNIPSEQLRNRALTGDVVLVVLDAADGWQVRKALGGEGAGGYSSAATGRSSTARSDSEASSFAVAEAIAEEDDEDEDPTVAANIAARRAYEEMRAARVHPIPAVASMYADDEDSSAPEAASAGSESDVMRLWRPRVDVRRATAKTVDELAAGVPDAATTDPDDAVAVARLAESLALPATVSGYALPVDVAGLKRAIVRASLQCKAGTVQPTGRVTSVLQRNHPMTFVGTLSSMGGGMERISESDRFVRLEPLNNAEPWVLIPRTAAPSDFLASPRDFKRKLYSAIVNPLRWTEHNRFPVGELKETLGESGNILTDLAAILVKHNIDKSPFSESVMAGLRHLEAAAATGGGWTVPEDEIARRRDLRSECIFTIDPTTAKVRLPTRCRILSVPVPVPHDLTLLLHEEQVA